MLTEANFDEFSDWLVGISLQRASDLLERVLRDGVDPLPAGNRVESFDEDPDLIVADETVIDRFFIAMTQKVQPIHASELIAA